MSISKIAGESSLRLPLASLNISDNRGLFDVLISRSAKFTEVATFRSPDVMNFIVFILNSGSIISLLFSAESQSSLDRFSEARLSRSFFEPSLLPGAKYIYCSFSDRNSRFLNFSLFCTGY